MSAKLIDRGRRWSLIALPVLVFGLLKKFQVIFGTLAKGYVSDQFISNN